MECYGCNAVERGPKQEEDEHGDQATVTVDISGAGKTFMDGPFPHAQHIHGQGTYPGSDADTDGGGVLNVTEGDTSPDSGLAVERFPGGSAYSYERTFELDGPATQALRSGTAVIVVPGVHPALMPAARGTHDHRKGHHTRDEWVDPGHRST